MSHGQKFWSLARVELSSKSGLTFPLVGVLVMVFMVQILCYLTMDCLLLQPFKYRAKEKFRSLLSGAFHFVLKRQIQTWKAAMYFLRKKVSSSRDPFPCMFGPRSRSVFSLVLILSCVQKWPSKRVQGVLTPTL